MRLFILTVCMLFLTSCATSSYENYRFNEYGCNGCNLPEPMKEGKALIYVIANTFWLNPSDHHHIYAIQDDERYMGSNREAHYCPIYVNPGEVTIKSVADNTDTLKFNVEAGSYYVVLQKRKSAISSSIGTKLELVGKDLDSLNMRIYGKCDQVL